MELLAMAFTMVNGNAENKTTPASCTLPTPQQYFKSSEIIFLGLQNYRLLSPIVSINRNSPPLSNPNSISWKREIRV
jgi:hypothetical protein